MDGQEEKGKEKYAHIAQLSTEVLQEILCADIESPDNADEEVIFYILEVLEQREKVSPTGRLSDVNNAWADFQKYYAIADGKDLSLYPTTDGECELTERICNATTEEQTQSRKGLRPRSMLKVACIAATLVVIIFGTLITVQAYGIDVFGAIGRWTDETFQFLSSTNEAAQSGPPDLISSVENINYHNSIQTVLIDIGITEELVPTWYPAGYEASEPQILSTRHSDIISVVFHGNENQFFSIVITRYQLEDNMATRTFEKDSTPVEQYTSGGKTFYIFSNIDAITATWSDGLLVEKISGNLTIDDLKAIIDSIGG